MKIAFYGDAFTDTFAEVRDIKVNPESGCPAYVVDGRRTSYPGGAGNAALTLTHFGVESLLFCNPHPGCDKVRLIYRGKQVARIDIEAASNIMTGSYIDAARHAAVKELIGTDGLDAIVISDYGRGFVDAKALATILDHANGIPVVIDAKRIFEGIDYARANVVFKPNAREAEALTGIKCPTIGASILAARLGCVVVVTREALPPIVADPEKGAEAVDAVPFPAMPFQPSGAGDWFAAFLAFNMVSMDTRTAAQLAYRQASATGFFPPFRMPVLSREVHAIDDPAKFKILPSQADLADWLKYRQRGRLVVTNGIYDLLHVGHVECLRACRALGDQLLVFINSDESARQLKGPNRPATTMHDRARMLANLDSVSAIAFFSEATPKEAFTASVAIMERPFDTMAKGGGYRPDDMEAEFPGLAREYVATPRYTKASTTAIIERMQAPHP